MYLVEKLAYTIMRTIPYELLFQLLTCILKIGICIIKGNNFKR